MADKDEKSVPMTTDVAKRPRGRPKGTGRLAKLIAEKTAEIKSELAETPGIAQSLDRNGRFVKGTIGNPTARPKYLSITAQFRAAAEDMNITQVIKEIGDGTRKATREQLEAIKIMLDRGYGRSAETHLVGAMDAEHREAVSSLTREQLLGLLDGPKPVLALEGGTVASSAAVVVEGTVIPEGTT